MSFQRKRAIICPSVLPLSTDICIGDLTGTCGQDTLTPFFHFHGLEICKTAIICRLMQSENGILLLFYIFLSYGNEKGGMLCPVHKYLWVILADFSYLIKSFGFLARKDSNYFTFLPFKFERSWWILFQKLSLAPH